MQVLIHTMDYLSKHPADDFVEKDDDNMQNQSEDQENDNG